MKKEKLFLILWMTTIASARSQVIIDVNAKHDDEIINYLGWNGTKLTAKITPDRQFEAFGSEMHTDFIINYITWDGTPWTARLEGDNFLHAPGGDWTRAHSDKIINYITHNRTRWTATTNGRNFTHTNQFSETHTSDHLNYITWNGTNWSTQLDKSKFTHRKGGTETVPKKTPQLMYLTWDKTEWIATINADGTFNHTRAGKTHRDRNMIYLTHNGTFWATQIHDGKFTHYQASLPPKKSVWKKIRDGFKGIELGFPEPAPPSSTPNTEERKGIFLMEQNGFTYYRPLGEVDVCTNHLSFFLTKYLVSKSKIKTCQNTGQVRDVYSFIIRKQ